jgi:ATP-binding cassette subfamily F protein uup
MALITLDGVHKAYPDRDLLGGVSLVVGEETRIGIVGANGSGKSTLIRILAGVVQPDSGTRRVRPGLRIGHLLQEIAVHAGTVRDAVRGGRAERAQVLAEIEALHERLAAGGDERSLLAALARLEVRRDQLGGHDIEHRVEELIDAVGLPDPDADASCLSGGEQRRVALARVLLAEPDVLLLDEPTNHLDAYVVDWLEDHLIRTRLPVVMVTHDRYFLDRVVDRVVEVELGALHGYEGGYAGYLRGKAEREETERKQEVGRQSLVRRETEWMRRGPPARSTKAKARIQQYHALLDDAPAAKEAELAFRIPPGPRLGTRVLRMRGVTLRVGDRTLVEGLDLDVGNGERLGIVGPNGAGKTTVLRTLIGERAPDEGSVEVGATVRLSAVDQQRRDLDDDATVVEELAGQGGAVRVGDRALRIEPFLDGFLFPGGRKHTRIGKLSGGERNRVLLAKLLIQGGNVLVLDEPTNDLDLPTLRALEEAILAFEGAVVVVSHDRWFLDRVATSLLLLDGHGGARKYGGFVTTLLEEAAEARREREARAAREKKARAEAARAGPAPAARKKTRRLSNWQERELAELPAQIEAAEPKERREAVESEQKEAVALTERLYARWEELESIREAE